MYILLEIHVTIIVDKYRKYPKPMILQSHILRHKCNQTVVCITLIICLSFLLIYLTSCLPEMRWKFPFDLNGKLDNSVFFKATHTFSKIPKSWYTVGGQG